MIGIDVIEISRFRDMKNLEVFIRRMFTDKEAEYFTSKSAAKRFYESVAGHFAAKEAFAKALGTGVRNFEMSDIEICHDELGMPYIKFGGVRINASVSISHSDTIASAVVYIGENIPGTSLPFYNDIDYYARLIPLRAKDTNKGSCGRILIIGGSVGMTGAPCLSAMGALRCGSGLVTVGVPKSQQPIVATKLTEAMTLPLPELEDGTISLDSVGEIKSKLNRSDVCVLGPGMSQNNDMPKLIESLISGSVNMVIDADALNVISNNMDLLKKHKNRMSCSIVITPHPGEMSRLSGKNIEAIQNDRSGSALSFAKEYGVTVVLKGKDTVIASPSGKVKVNQSGSEAMASGGMGDALSGIIAGLIGQGLECYDGAVLGTFVHGVAGDLARSEIGDRGILATDLCDRIPKALRMISNAG